ncbi:MAG: metallophosphoesterase family protein [Myxococcales bacterium]|nr:metallophosphoesterase family protein [Myxococcales bacterium]
MDVSRRQHLPACRQATPTSFLPLFVLAMCGAFPQLAQGQEELPLVEPVQLIEFGDTWQFREGNLEGERQPLLDGQHAPLEESWYEGATPFLARSEAVQDELERMDRRRRRRGSRHQSSTVDGTLEVYDASAYAIPPGMPSDYEPGPHNYVLRRTFTVDDPASLVSAFLEVRFSGGFVAYLNGREWIRHNVNTANETGLADIVWQPGWVAQTVGNVWQRAFTGLPTDRLVEGENDLTIVLYRRWSGGSRALYFDAQLRVYDENGFIKTPYLQAVTMNGISVMWETTAPGVGFVEYGSGSVLNRVASSPRVASTLQEVRIEDLEPDTRYFYRVHTVLADDPTQVVSSPMYYFRTAVPEGQPFTFLLYGDNRTNSETHSTLVQRMIADGRESDARFIVNTGDLTTNASWWDEWQDEFFEPALPLLSYFPIYAALGNHEGNHETWYEYLSLPNNESWYSFRYGDAEFFGLNTSAGLEQGTAQYEWLENALASSEATWKIAFFHHPPYSCVPIRKPGSPVIQENLVPLFETYGVQLVMLGHDHLYGRSYPLNGVTYVISGGGGASTYPAEPDEFNEICVQTHHYCIVRVTPSSVSLEATTIEGELLDSFTLTP